MMERPIIFSGDMVRAILDGRKTMTRRVIKPQPTKQGHLWYWRLTAWDNSKVQVSDLSPLDKCPYGQAGDFLWVRESWATNDFFTGISGEDLKELYYEQRGVNLFYRADCDPWHLKQGFTVRWRPSIHMPRWASRILLEITDIRVERLQEITEEDAMAEGCRNQVLSNFAPHFDIAIKPASIKFKELWDSLNAKRGYGWEVNPWVWVISFKGI